MHIEKMNPADIDIIVSLYKDANTFATTKDIKQWTLEGLKKYPDYNFVYKQHKKIVGAISAVKKKDILEINDIGVVKSKRNKGIGSNLMHYFFEHIPTSTIKKVTLWVHRKNTAAIPFYYKFGFTIKKCLKTKNISGVPDGEDIIYLEKYI